MSSSVSSSLAEAMAANGMSRGALGRGDADGVAVDALDRARDLLGAVDRLGELEARFVPGPVGIIGAAGQRAVDAGRADFEPVAALDRVAALGFQRVEHFRQPARNRLAIGERRAGACRAARPSPAASGPTSPPIIATRTRSKPRALTSGSISCVKRGECRPSAVLHAKIKTVSGPASGGSQPQHRWRCRGESGDIGVARPAQAVSAAQRCVLGADADAEDGRVEQAEDERRRRPGRRPAAGPRSRPTTTR